MENQTNQTKQNDRFQKINNLILSNEEFLVVANGDDFDSVASATGLSLLLKSLGKKVTLYSPKSIKAGDFSSLKGMDQFSPKLETNTNKLSISLNCPLSQIERVASNDEGEKLNLVVEFKEGTKAIDPSQVKVNRSGPSYQAGFIFDTQLENEAEIVKQGQWVWLSKTGLVKPWAHVSLVEKKATLSESTISAVSRGGFEIPEAAVDNFYWGIKMGTDNFEKADSIALETAAYCLRIKEAIEKRKTQPRKEEQPPIETIEKKEGNLQTPPIFTGATTPKV